MINHDGLGSPMADIRNLKLQPATARLRPMAQPLAAAPAMSSLPAQAVADRWPPAGDRGVERRDLAARQRLLQRICGEFEEMPGLAVTQRQAIKLFGLTPEAGTRIFRELIAARVLRITQGLYYMLRLEE